MSAIPQLLPQPLLASAKPLSRYSAPSLVGQRKPVASVGVTRPEQRLQSPPDETEAIATWAFYRKHTEKMLRRYLYASMQVGRSPEVLQNSVGRGWVSSRRVSTFEDAVIFVMDIERCLARLSRAERLLLERVILQEYTYPEAADLMGLSVRVLARKIPETLDKLTELLVNSKLLLLTD